MRKLAVAMLLVLAGTVCAIAQEQEVTYKVGIDSESIAEAAEVLEKYVDGPLGRYYAAAVRRQVIIGKGKVVLLSIGMVLCLAFIFRVARGIPAEAHDEVDTIDVAIITFGALVVLANLGLLLLDALPRCATPEFYAARDILQSLH